MPCMTGRDENNKSRGLLTINQRLYMAAVQNDSICGISNLGTREEKGFDDGNSGLHRGSGLLVRQPTVLQRPASKCFRWTRMRATGNGLRASETQRPQTQSRTTLNGARQRHRETCLCRFFSSYSSTSRMFSRRRLPASPGVSGRLSTLELDSRRRTRSRSLSVVLCVVARCSGEPRGAGPVRMGGSCRPSIRAERLSSRKGSDVTDPVRGADG